MKTILIALTFVMISSSVLAQTTCNKRSKFLDYLAKGYKESPIAMGLVSNGSVLEVLASKKGTWTIIVTNTQGRSCVVAFGVAWEEIERVILEGPAT